MKRIAPHIGLRILALTTCLTALLAGYFTWVEPWMRHWGATPDEIARTLPGDEIIPVAAAQQTRAITIYAPVDEVWPWLAQLGRDRGGFYSFDLLENIFGCEMPTRDELRPEWQTWQLGDKLWMYPENKAGGAGFATLRSYVPGRVLGFGTRPPGTPLSDPEMGSWTFVLEPVNATATRLLIRGRIGKGGSLAWRVFDRLVFDPAHFVMERRMMLGLKQLAEQSSRHRAVNHVHAVLWIIVAGFSLAALYLVLVTPHWIRALVALVGALLAFQFLTFGQPMIGIAVLTTIAVAILFVGTGQEHDHGAFIATTRPHGT